MPPTASNPAELAAGQLVSVIIPTHHRAASLQTALESVVAQSYRPVEVLVVDDGSKVGALDAVRAWAERHQAPDLALRFFSQAHLGAPAARNLGMRHARGTYLQFLDSDDTLDPEKLSRQVAALELSGAELAVSDFCYRYTNGVADQVALNNGSLRWRMVLGWSPWGASGLLRAAAVGHGLWWNERLTRQQDIDFMFRVLAAARSYIYTPFIGAHYIQHDDNERISDRYERLPTPWGERIRSLACFALSPRAPVGFRGRAWLAIGALKLLVSAGLDHLRVTRARLNRLAGLVGSR